MSALKFVVIGAPGAQGSKRHVGGGRMVESSKKVAPWRQDVVAAARQAAKADSWETPAGPLLVTMTFFLPRPGYHFGSGRNAGVLKAAAPKYVARKPDADKLARSTCDALTTSGVIRDDAQVARLQVTKVYADPASGEPAQGCVIDIRPLDRLSEAVGVAR